MHFTSAVFVAAVALCGSVFSAPVQVAPLAEVPAVQLDRRAVAAQYFFSGDLATVAVPAFNPGDKAGAKAAAKAGYTNKDRLAKQETAKAAVGMLLNSAQPRMGLPAAMQVRVINNFHTSKDPVRHVTFKFIHPNCGLPNNECTGHAYWQPDGHGLGKIFPDVGHGGENAPPIFAA